MHKAMQEMVERAVDLENNHTLDAACTWLCEQFKAAVRTRRGDGEILYEALLQYAAKCAVNEYVRTHRKEPIPALNQVVDESDQVIVREVDRRYTPQPATAEERAENMQRIRKRLFEFRINQAGRQISIWNASRETIEVEINRRQKQIDGQLHHQDFLVAVFERLQPSQTPAQAGITNDEMHSLYRSAVGAI